MPQIRIAMLMRVKVQILPRSLFIHQGLSPDAVNTFQSLLRLASADAGALVML